MKTSTRQLIVTAVMGAIAFILMMFSFPILPAIPFLKVDFSDVPILFTTFLFGPWSGAGAAFVRNFLHYMQTGGNAGYPIGDIASFIATLSYCLPIYYILRNYDLRLSKQVETAKYYVKVCFAFAIGSVLMTFVLSLANYYVITPFYMAVMNFEIPNMQEYILYGIVPFNLLKGLIISITNFIVLSAALPVAKRRLV